MHTSTIRNGSVLGWNTGVAAGEDRGYDRQFSPFSVDSIRGQVSRWWMRARTRRELAAMDDHMLSDIGLSRVDALRESRKPFWLS